MIIAIDGPVGSGKSTAGRRLAQHLGLPFVDSGQFYRALALVALDAGLEPGQDAELTRLAHSVAVIVSGDNVLVDGRDVSPEIYRPDLNRILSPLAEVAGVREALVAQQRRLARDGVVMVGRDIGTVVFPDADFKFFLTASVEERVRRRSAQYERRGISTDRDAMAREVAERDRIDSQRVVSPLRPADDALIIETDGMTLDQVVEHMLERVKEKH